MWIIFFNGVPSFWLVGDSTYRAGKRDCDVNIEDDKSVSRSHLLFSVGLTRAQHIDPSTMDDAEAHLSSSTPAPLTLTDGSTYGTVVYPCGKAPTSADDDVEAAAEGVEAGPSHSVSTLLASAVGLGNGVGTASRDGSRVTSPGALAEWPAVGEAHRLAKGAPFEVPCDDPRWHVFTAVLGNHGAALVFAWVPVHVLVEAVEPDWYTKLEQALNRCGAFILHDADEDPSAGLTSTSAVLSPAEKLAARRLALYKRVDLLVSTSVQPTPAVVALLCRGVPIVTPAFFMDVRDRATAQVPLPDVKRYTPPLAGTFWEQLVHHIQHDHNNNNNNNNNGGDDDQAGARDITTASQTTREATTLMLPHPRRQRLLSGLTFVVFQAPLYEEVAQYVACAGGGLHLDQTLANAVNARTTQATLDAFLACHSQHVVLYSQTERMPFRECLETLRDRLGLPCVEYADLIAALFLVRPLALTPFPTAKTEPPSSATASARVSGRRTDAQPLFPELYAHNKSNNAQNGAAGVTLRDPHRRVDTEGWISRASEAGETAQDAAGERVVMRQKRGRPSAGAPQDDGFEQASVTLPPYPCFCLYRPHGADAHASSPTSTSTHVMSTGKAFHKQSVPPREAPVELMELHGGALGAQLLTSRVPAVDSDDLIADRAQALRSGGGATAAPIGRVSVAGAFNAFDTAAQNSINRKKGTARRAPRAGTTTTATGERAAVRVTETVTDTVAIARQTGTRTPSPPPPPPPAAAAPASNVFNVFDIEGIY